MVGVGATGAATAGVEEGGCAVASPSTGPVAPALGGRAANTLGGRRATGAGPSGVATAFGAAPGETAFAC